VILQILIVFILINAVLKGSYRKPLQTALFGLLCGGFIIATCPLAVMQSKTQLADFLKDTHVAQNMAVLLTVESTVFFAFCVYELTATKRHNLLRRLLNIYPGLLIFPVLFYLLTQLVFSMTGMNFTRLSYLFAAAVALAFPLLSLLCRRLLPERESRLEATLLVSIFVCVIGLISTVNGTTVYAAINKPPNLQALSLAIGGFLLFFFIGLIINKLKWKFKNKTNGNNL